MWMCMEGVEWVAEWVCEDECVCVEGVEWVWHTKNTVHIVRNQN